MTYPAGTILVERHQNKAVRVTPHRRYSTHDGVTTWEQWGYLIEPVNYYKKPYREGELDFYSTEYILTVYRPIREEDKAFLV
jgi:hypothetical protein